MLALLLLACVCPSPPDTGSGVGIDTDKGAPADSGQDSGQDTAPDTSERPFACPVGMSPVPADAPTYCISTYEVSVVDGSPPLHPG